MLRAERDDLHVGDRWDAADVHKRSKLLQARAETYRGD